MAVPGIPETNIKVLEKLVPPNEEELKKLVETQVKTILEAQQKRLKEAEWDTAYINDLPDSAFAVVSKGGTKADQNKTEPRTLRHLPHHKADGSMDIPHLRNALARLSQTDLTPEEQSEAKRHIQHSKDTRLAATSILQNTLHNTSRHTTRTKTRTIHSNDGKTKRNQRPRKKLKQKQPVNPFIITLQLLYC